MRIGIEFQREKVNLIKNVIAFNLSFVLIYASLNCVTTIQSVIIEDGTLAIVTQITRFVVQLIGSFVLPQVCYEKYGSKWTLALSELLAFIYLAAQIFPKWSVFIPCNSILLSHIKFLLLLFLK